MALRELRLSGELLASEVIYLFYQRQVFVRIRFSFSTVLSICMCRYDILQALGCGRSRYDSISIMAVTARTAYCYIAN